MVWVDVRRAPSNVSSNLLRLFRTALASFTGLEPSKRYLKYVRLLEGALWETVGSWRDERTDAKSFGVRLVYIGDLQGRWLCT